MDYNLLPNEAIVLKNESVYHPVENKIGELGELVLTNLNAIYIRKGFFGGTKEILKYPLNQIKILDGKPQVIIGKSSNGFYQIELYLKNGQEFFAFNTLGKKEALKWLDKISEILTGHIADIDSSERSYIPGIDVVADTLKNTIGTFKGAFGAKDKEKENVTSRCISCRAPLSGVKGQIIKCKYCDTEQSL